MKNMKKLIGLLLSVALILTMLPLAYADGETTITTGVPNDFYTYESAYLSAGATELDLTSVAGHYNGSPYQTYGAYDKNNGTAMMLFARNTGDNPGATYTWNFDAPKYLCGIAMNFEKFYGRQWSEYGFYTVSVIDLGGNAHVVYDMTTNPTGSYAVNIPVNMIAKGFQIYCYSMNQIEAIAPGSTVSGYDAAIFNEIGAYAKDAGFSSANSSSEYTAFNEAHLATENVVRITADQLTTEGSYLWGSLASMTNGNVSDAAVWDNGSRDNQISFKLANPASLKAITIGTEQLYGRVAYNYSFYKVLVKDTNGVTTEIFDMTWLSGKNYFDIPVPASVGFVDTVIFDTYSDAEIDAMTGTTDASSNDNRAFALNELGIFAYNYATVYEATEGSQHMLDYINFLEADIEANGGEILNPELTISGDLNTSIGLSAPNPKPFYDLNGNYSLIWNSRIQDVIWSSDAPMKVTSIGLVTEQSARKWEASNYYRVFVTDTMGQKHYLYDANKRVAQKYAVCINVPAEIGMIQNAGFEFYTKDQVAALEPDGTCDDDAFFMQEFVVVGTNSVMVSEGKTFTGVGANVLSSYGSVLSNLNDGNTSALGAILEVGVNNTSSPFFKLDLGRTMPLAEVMVYARPSGNKGEANCRIYGTNDASVTDVANMTLLGVIKDNFPGNGAVRALSSYKADGVTDLGSYRYLAFASVPGERGDGWFILSEVKAYAYAAETGAPQIAITKADGTATAVATVVKGTDTKNDMMLVLAQYNGDKLVAVNYKDIDTRDMNMWVEQDFDTTITMDGDGEIRSFLMVSDSLQPVGGVVTQ